VSDASGTANLGVDDVLKLIAAARAGASDAVSTSLVIFQGLGDNVILAGDVLRQALAQASLALDGPLAATLAAVGTITKTGSLVTLVNNQELRPVLRGNTLRLKPTVTFQVGLDGDLSLNNIAGLAVHEVIWIDIHQVQLRQQDGLRIVHVVTAHGTRDFPLS